MFACLHKDGKELYVDFKIRLVLHQWELYKFSLHIYSFCTLNCTWSNSNSVGFISFLMVSLLSDRKQPLVKLVKTFLIYRLKEEILFFFSIVVRFPSLFLWSWNTTMMNRVSICMFVCFLSNFYFIKRKNDPSEVIWLKKSWTEIIQGPQSCHALWVKGQHYWLQLMVNLMCITVTADWRSYHGHRYQHIFRRRYTLKEKVGNMKYPSPDLAKKKSIKTCWP